MTKEERRKRIQSWFNKDPNVTISHTWNGVQRGDPAVWDETGEECMFVAHATDANTDVEWWTFAIPERRSLMHAKSVYFVWSDGPPLHGVR